VTGLPPPRTPGPERIISATAENLERPSLICSAMIDSSITFIDSGIGGLPYLDWIRNRRPDLPLAYLADTAHFPYGDLDSDGVREAVLIAVNQLLQAGTPRLIVIACNTASVFALEEIRAIAPCPVVGTVPAVKPAAGLSAGGPIGVLATKGTVDSPYLDQLVNAFAGGQDVIRVAAGDIVRFVEERWLEEGDNGAIPVISPALDSLKSSDVRSVVLGCTHFLHVMKAIEKIMGPDVPLVDSRDGVGRRILSLLNEGSSAAENSDGSVVGTFMVTGSGFSDERYEAFAGLHGLKWVGEIS
jgi:glutamate racemase